MPNFTPCRHLFTDGHQCGSPALRGEPLCFYHAAARRPIEPKIVHGVILPQLPAPDDLHAIQRGLCELLRLLATDELDPRRAATMLRVLNAASANLARIHRQDRQRDQNHPTAPVNDLVNHPDLGPIAPEVQTSTQQNEYFRTSEEKNSAPILRQSPEPSPLPPTGPLTLNEQYVHTERDHRLTPNQRRHALNAIAKRLVAPTPAERDRDRDILASREAAAIDPLHCCTTPQPEYAAC